METHKEKMKAIADAIRGKEGTAEPIAANSFAQRIEALPAPGEETYGIIYEQVDQEGFPTEITLRVPGEGTLPYLLMGGEDYGGQGDAAWNRVRKVNWPDRFRRIGNGAFEYMERLEQVDLSRIQEVGINAFNFTALTTVNAPVVEKVNQLAFQDCPGLKSVTLGSPGHPVREIGYNAFGFYAIPEGTHEGLTVTVYTQGGEPLAGDSQWGLEAGELTYLQA